MAGSGGYVGQRPSGLWEGRYRLAGHQKAVYGKTKLEVQEKLRKALVGADNGIRQPSNRLTVNAWLDEWLAGGRWRPRTLESYTETAARYIRPAIGKTPLAKLEASDIARMLAKLEARGDLSSTTVRYAYSVLRIALGRAVKSGKVSRNVATLVDPPAKARVQLHPLTADEARRFLASVAGGRLGPLYTVAIATGARQGELLALRWDAIDLDGGTLVVLGTLRRGTSEVAEPKTERSKRTLVLSAVAIAALRAQRVRQVEERLAAGRRWRGEGFVFTTGTGGTLDSRNVTQTLQDALERAGLPRQRFHDLRHAYATLMLEAGEELAVVSRSLGHSNLSTTADVYAHLTRTMQDRSAARMDGILGTG
jgi:integrase